MPPLILLLPVLFFNSFLARLLNRIKLRFNSTLQDLSYEIVYNKKHYEYMNAANRIIPKYYDGFHKYDKERIKWSRINVSSERFRPTYILVKKKGEIIGGASLIHQNIYAFKFGIKFRIGYMHDYFLDKNQFKNPKELHLGYKYLFDKIIKAATKRKIGVFISMLDSHDKILHGALRSMRLLQFKGAAVMIKPMNNLKSLPELKKPIFVPTYVSKGVP